MFGRRLRLHHFVAATARFLGARNTKNISAYFAANNPSILGLEQRIPSTPNDAMPSD